MSLIARPFFASSPLLAQGGPLAEAAGRSPSPDSSDAGESRRPRVGRFRFNLKAILIVVVFLLGFGLRVYDLTDPPLDFHPARQLRSALIARAVFYQLDAHADPYLRQQATNLADLEVYEPPILEALVGFADHLVGQENFWMGRIFNALFWVIGGLALYALGRRYASFYAVLLALAFYFFLPFSVIASRSFQPDPWMVMWILWFAYALCRWAEQPGWKWALISGALGGVAVLVKLVAIYFVGGMLGAALLAYWGLRLVRQRQAWAMLALVLAPALIYYGLFNAQRSAGFFSFWTVSLSRLVLTSNFYADWLSMANSLVGLTNFMAALLGVALAARTIRPLLAGGWIGYGLYGLMFPYQYVTHEYYHLPLVALIALSLLPLLDVLLRKLAEQAWLWRAAAVGVLLFASFYSVWVSRSVLYAVSYTLEPASWARVGAAIPEGHSFVALTADYGMRLRYYGWRNASAFWPSSGDLRLLALRGDSALDTQAYFDEITAGKDYFLVTAFSELDAQPELKAILYDHYAIYVEGNGFTVFDLKHPLTDASP